MIFSQSADSDLIMIWVSAIAPIVSRDGIYSAITNPLDHKNIAHSVDFGAIRVFPGGVLMTKRFILIRRSSQPSSDANLRMI